MSEYIPSPWDWVAEHVEQYEGSGGAEGAVSEELGGGKRMIIVTNRGRKTGAIRKTPLMRVVDGDRYLLVASIGGAPENPLWVYNLRADPKVEIRDGAEVHSMQVREAVDPTERKRVWDIAVESFPSYQTMQEKTDRVIPVFVAEATG